MSAHPWITRLYDLTDDHRASDNGSFPEALEAVKNDGARWLLIETSRYDASAYLTAWTSPEDAATYVENSEYPEDWPERTLYDLATGNRYYASTRPTWHPYPTDHAKATR